MEVIREKQTCTLLSEKIMMLVNRGGNSYLVLYYTCECIYRFFMESNSCEGGLEIRDRALNSCRMFIYACDTSQ